MRVTKAQYTAACEYAAKVYSGELKPATAIKTLQAQHGINPNSARDFIDDYRHLCRGEVFQRAMSGDAMRHFISHIANTQGATGLRKALQSLERHVQYYESGGKRTLVMRKVVFPSRCAASGKFLRRVCP